MNLRRARLKPRNVLATSPLLKKGGAHQRKGKRAKRAKQAEAFRRELARDE